MDLQFPADDRDMPAVNYRRRRRSSRKARYTQAVIKRKLVPITHYNPPANSGTSVLQPQGRKEKEEKKMTVSWGRQAALVRESS